MNFDYGFALLNAIYNRFGVRVIIEGGATGADRLAATWADHNPVVRITFPAKWDDLDVPNCNIRINKFGKEYNALAGFNRNQQMIDEGKPDLCVAFPGGSGTADMIARCEKAGIKVIKVTK